MIVFWQTETGRFIKDYNTDSIILDKGDTWDVYSADGRLLTNGIRKSDASYGYFKDKKIAIVEDEEYNPIPIYINDLDLQAITGDDLPRSHHIGKLIAVDPQLAKPATVRRKWHGETYDIQCLVSQSVVDMWQADTLNVNDYVIVSYVDEIIDSKEINLAIVVDKIYKSYL